MQRSSSNKEDQIFLKASFEGDIIPGIKPPYTQLFRMCDQLEKENTN